MQIENFNVFIINQFKLKFDYFGKTKKIMENKKFIKKEETKLSG